MDAKIILIGEEAGPYVTLKELKEKRIESEKIPPPEQRKNRFDSWKAEKEKSLRSQMKQFAQGMVQGIPPEIWSEESLFAHVEKNLNKENVRMMWPFILLQYLPLVVESLEVAVYARESQAWNTRLQGFDNSIAVMTSQLPKPFSPELINKDPRFPVERCGQTSDGKWFDRWLALGLKEKKLIMFDSPQYVEYLIRYYHEVYWATAERERVEALKQVTPPVEPSPQSTTESFASGLHEFYEMGREKSLDDELVGGRRKSIIYK